MTSELLVLISHKLTFPSGSIISLIILFPRNFFDIINAMAAAPIIPSARQFLSRLLARERDEIRNAVSAYAAEDLRQELTRLQIGIPAGAEKLALVDLVAAHRIRIMENEAVRSLLQQLEQDEQQEHQQYVSRGIFIKLSLILTEIKN